MFIRNGQALGSVLHSAAPRAERPKKRTSKAAKATAAEQDSPRIEYVGYIEDEKESPQL